MIPPKYTGTKWGGWISDPTKTLSYALKKMAVGESMEWDREKGETQAYNIAKKIGIRVTLRRLGKEGTVTIFRSS